MEALNTALTWILEISGTVVLLLGALFWLKAAGRGESTARSFMALIFTFVYFLAVVLRADDLGPRLLIVLTVVYGAILVIYIVARMVEHREEIRSGEPSLSTTPSSIIRIILDDIDRESGIDAGRIALETSTRGLLRKRKVIRITGTVPTEETKRRVGTIAQAHAVEDYEVLNDLVVR